MRKLRTVACGLCVVAVVALSGCQALFPAAVRINYDGSVDYVTCHSGTPGLDESRAMSYASSHQTNGLEIQPVSELGVPTAGQVVHFQRPTAGWKSILVGSSTHSLASARADHVSLGEWIWNAGDHCTINE
ncbi:hypothetical protein [Microbacterium sp. MYb64]|uniref:hypothetical protein n=1 Tax=Microbacterium sp. MYb64 TaxID=1848691 RepID=UPI0011B02777|nr:hypothetical protein [Microbacterium sp. MYb64]